MLLKFYKLQGAMTELKNGKMYMTMGYMITLLVLKSIFLDLLVSTTQVELKEDTWVIGVLG